MVLIATNFSRLPTPRATMDAGANAAVLPIVSVASLVGFGAVVASLPAFEAVKAWVLGIEVDHWSRLPWRPIFLPRSPARHRVA